MINHALIMAAGRGLRMRPFTDSAPKAMAPWRDTTLIARGIEMVHRRVPNVHVTVGYRGAMLAEHVIQHGASTVLNTEGRGNSWWLYNTFLSLVDEPVLVLTCDNVVELDFDAIEADYRERGRPACMLVPVPPVPGIEGDYIDETNHIVRRLSRSLESALYCSGIQIVNPVKIRYLTTPVQDFSALWNQLIPFGQVRTSRVYEQEWFSVDTFEQLVRMGHAQASPD